MEFPRLENLVKTSYTDIPALPLTLEKLEEAIEAFGSPARRLREWERMKRVSDGEVILIKAREAGVISEYEFSLLLIGVYINGGLIVSSEMYGRLHGDPLRN